MPITAGAIAGGAGLVSSLIGSHAASDQTDAANAARQKALQQWLSVNVPDPAQQAIELQKYKVTGQLSPQLEQAFQQSQTGLKDLSIDPTSREAEVQALTQMQNIGSQGGMDAQARQMQAQAINAANANEQGQRGAIEQNFAARGVGGTGAELAAELQASQGDANQAAASGLSASASAEQRALQAMASAGNMGATLNNQDYGQAAKAAEAQDAINRFNTQTQQSTSNANVSANNEAQAGNLKTAQGIANNNVDLSNKEEVANKALLQQQFQNEAQVAGGKANAENGIAQQANQNAGQQTQLWGNIGNAIAQGAGAIGQAANSKSSQKPDPNDPSSSSYKAPTDEDMYGGGQ